MLAFVSLRCLWNWSVLWSADRPTKFDCLNMTPGLSKWRHGARKIVGNYVNKRVVVTKKWSRSDVRIVGVRAGGVELRRTWDFEVFTGWNHQGIRRLTFCVERTASKWLYSLQLAVSRFWLLISLHGMRIYSCVNIGNLRLSSAHGHRCRQIGGLWHQSRESIEFSGERLEVVSYVRLLAD